MNCDQLFCLSALCCIWTLNSNLVFGAKKDLYGILGIERTANEKDIKRAFRKLAVKYHPDKNKDPDAEKQFVEIAKAYEVLSDPERRRRYDQYGDDGEQSSGGGGGGGFNFNFNDFFKGYDEAFKTHHDHDHDHAHQDGFKFHFGGGNGGQHAQFFNFDDLFEDDDDNNNDFLNFDPFSNLDMNFGFGFDDDDDDDIFGHQVHNHYDRAHNQHAQHMHNHAKNMHQHKQQHMNMEHNMHAHHNMKMENVRVNSQGGRTCRTVTQRVGNTVTTHTECS